MIGERLLVWLTSVALLGSPLRAATDWPVPPPVGEAICALERAASRAYLAHDRAFLDTLFADDFEHTNFKGGVADKRQELDFFASPELSMGAATIDSCAVRAYGDVAVATGVTTWTRALYKGGDLSGVYRFTRVYHHQAGHWQIVASHFSKLPPAS